MNHHHQARVWGAFVLGGALLCVGARTVFSQDAAPLPLVGHWTFDDTDGVLRDSGPNKLNGKTNGLGAVEGRVGGALDIRDGKAARVDNNALLNGSDKFSLSLWIKLPEKPTRDAGLVAKRDDNSSTPFVLSLTKAGRLGFEGFDGSGWVGMWPEGGTVPVGQWAHVAVTYAAGGEAVMYLNGRRIAGRKVARALAGNDQGLNFGKDPFRGNFTGQMDDVRIFAAALSAEQIAALANGENLPTRAATKADFAPPMQQVEITLGRYDTPRANTEGLGRVKINAERVPGPNAVDWPKIFWRDQVLMEKGSSQKIDALLREGDAARGFFQKKDDEVLQPGNHWFRPLQWMWGRRHVYHANRVARSDYDNYELWVFPVKLSGDIQSVVLKNDGREIYNRTEKLESLTLLLPQNEAGKPYEIAVNGQPFQRFNAGLKPVVVGDPKEELIPVNLAVPGTNVQIANLERPEKWAYEKEWKDDVAAQNNPEERAKFAAPPTVAQSGFARYLGVDVPRSPLEIYTVSLTHGMSGGHFMRSEHKSSGPNSIPNAKQKFEGGAEEYARFLSDTGYDLVYEMAGNNSFDGTGERSYANLARALGNRGIRFGVTPGADWKRPFLAHPNLAFFTLNLPDYRAPLYRDVQLFSQRLHRNGNFAGISIGADNAAYESFWAWAPPEPGRPWGEAFVNFAHEGQPTLQRPLSWPEPKSLDGNSSVKEFQDYIARYNKGFEQYGYFGRALRAIDPKLSATTGSYGSSPGVGGRGGYPWATIPAKSLFANLDVMQAYDWNEVPSSKPLHNVALLDRAHSYYPEKELRSLVDDFGLFFGREARQRAYILSATRGIQTVGTSFLASPYNAKPHVYADQKELFGFLKSRGGAFKNTRPDAQIGVLYVNEQALLRRPNQEGNPKDDVLLNGSHEGKTTEALIMAHAAGFPAKIITPEEIKRGLPSSMRAILLVGLNREDPSWVWHEGLEGDLAKFTQSGGKILRDSQSVVPSSVAPGQSIETGIQARAYIAQGAGTQGYEDKFPKILERNADNIKRLQSAMQGVAAPVAKSDSPTVWAVPHTTGDVQYVSVVNWGYEADKNASIVVKPQIGALKWNTNREIYDLKTSAKTTLEAAKSVDLTKDGFQIFALPSRPVTAPKISAQVGNDGFYTATVDVGGMRGVPVQIQLVRAGEAAILYGASGEPIRLPFKNEEAGTVAITATELLSESSATATVKTVKAPLAAPNEAQMARVKQFLARRAPLVLALTPAQKTDAKFQNLSARLTKWMESKGRKVQFGDVAPNGVVLSPQPLKTSQTFPRWRTQESDLILLGTPADNLLIFDQLRGGLLDENAGAKVTYSPFVGEFNALNLVGEGAELESLVAQIERS